MSNDLQKIEADKRLLADVLGKLPGWIEEAGLMADMAANSERTGVRPDVRTGARAGNLAQDLKAWQDRLASAPDSDHVGFTTQKRILKAMLEAISAEVPR